MQDRRAYICCARADKAAALRLRRMLSRMPPQTGVDRRVGDNDAEGAFGPVSSALLEAAPLNKTLRLEIESSDWLILLCSPASLTPAMEEAAMIFKAKARAHRIIPVVLDGEPGASRTPGLGHRECLPRALLFAADAAGALTDHAVTPNFVDQRSDGLRPSDAAAEIASRITGAPTQRFRSVARRRQRRIGLLAGAAAAAALAVLTLSPIIMQDMEALGRAKEARAAGQAAHAALDQGRRPEAIEALTRIFPRGFSLARPPYTVPEEALSALNRVALETRLLADLPAPGADIEQLVPTSAGAVIAITAAAGAYLVDPGAGETVQIYRPGREAVSRVSPDGATLWTARFGADARNADGVAYAPLIFEDVDLASGEITVNTAVQSLPPGGGAAAISPDGARFAVDMGPGHGDQTLIAIFSRRDQSLVGVTTLPAHRAQVAFLGPDRLLLTTNPPSIFGQAPGLYLWRLAEDRPRVLRAPGRMPVCPDTVGAPRRALAAEIAAGRLPAADWTVSEDGTEIALLLPSLNGGSCILRWDAQTGRQSPTMKTRKQYRKFAFAIAGGPYALAPDIGELTLVSETGAIRLSGCDGAARYIAGGADPLILCASEDGETLHHGFSGQRRWRSPALSALTAAAYDHDARRLIMARKDGRLHLWDGAARAYPVARTQTPATLAQPDRDHVAALVTGAPPSIFDLSGRPLKTVDATLLARIQPVDQPRLLALAATGGAVAAENCAPLVAADVIHRSDSPSGRRAAIETADGLAVYDRATCLPVARFETRTTGSGPMLVSDDLLWAPLPGEISVFPLSIAPGDALASLHARALAASAE